MAKHRKNDKNEDFHGPHVHIVLKYIAENSWFINSDKSNVTTSETEFLVVKDSLLCEV